MDIDFDIYNVTPKNISNIVENWIAGFDRRQRDLDEFGLEDERKELIREAFMYGLCFAFQIASNEMESCQTVVDAQVKLDVMHVETSILARKATKRRLDHNEDEIDFDVTKP